LTVLVLFAAGVLSWTDPDQVEMRQMAWDTAMEKLREKQVIHAQRFVRQPISCNFFTFSMLTANSALCFVRYSEQYRFRPAASPIITESS
jgi:hypothetical protein